MATDPMLVAGTSLLSAGIGAGAALIGQLVSRRSEAKLATLRLRSEEQRHAANLSARAVQMLFENRRMLFAAILGLASERLELMSLPMWEGIGEVAEAQSFNLVGDPWFASWRSRRNELELLAPSLRPQFDNVGAAFNSWRDQIGPRYVEEATTYMSSIALAVTTLEGEMQKLLGTN